MSQLQKLAELLYEAASIAEANGEVCFELSEGEWYYLEDLGDGDTAEALRMVADDILEEVG